MKRSSLAIVGALLLTSSLAATGCAVESAPESEGAPESAQSQVEATPAVPAKTGPALTLQYDTKLTLPAAAPAQPPGLSQDPDPNPWKNGATSAPSPDDPDPNPWCRFCVDTTSPLDPDPNPWCSICFKGANFDPDPNPWKPGVVGVEAK